MNNIGKSFLGKFGQVGFVVEDAERIATAYAQKFGVGPWRITHLKADPNDEDPLAIIARCWVGETDFELIQSNIPQSIHAQFREKRGDSLHHLCFYPANYDLCFEKLEKMGYPLLEQGGFKGGIQYAYFDTTRDLGFIVEIACFPEGNGDPYPAHHVIEAKGDSLLTKFAQVGFVVGDSEQISTTYAEKFGIGPWRVTDLKINSDDEVPLSIISRCWVGETDFELIQSNIPKPQIHTEFHEKWGDTLHHLCFYPTDYDLCYHKLKEQGYPLLEEGNFPGGVRYAYFDTTCDLGFIVEIAFFPPELSDPSPISRLIEVK